MPAATSKSKAVIKSVDFNGTKPNSMLAAQLVIIHQMQSHPISTTIGITMDGEVRAFPG